MASFQLPSNCAWVVSPDRSRVLMMHHRKLDQWFQPGGHADGDADILRVALRESCLLGGALNLERLGEVPMFECHDGRWLTPTQLREQAARFGDVWFTPTPSGPRTPRVLRSATGYSAIE